MSGSHQPLNEVGHLVGREGLEQHKVVWGVLLGSNRVCHFHDVLFCGKKNNSRKAWTLFGGTNYVDP